MEHRALGKGLSALIPERSQDAEQAGAKQKDVSLIKTANVRNNALQPRGEYDDRKLEELIASIKEKGILQPILVRPVDDGFEVVAGERRLRAARSLNLDEIPAVVRDVNNQEALILALIENIQREELNPIEEAKAFRRLIEEFALSHDDVAQSVGKERSTISNTLRLLKLPQDIQDALVQAQLSMGHARALVALPDEKSQRKVFDLIRKKGLSVREVENLIKSEGTTPSRRKKSSSAKRNTDLVFLEEDLQQVLGTKVRILAQRKRGKLVIEFYSPDDLERILQIIKSR